MSMLRVLVVDDEASIRALLRRWLAAAGFDVVEASSAEDALGLAMAGVPPAVVLADIRMPGGSGIWLAAQLRTRLPETAVVMATGVYELDSAVGSMQAGSIDYLAKPFTRERLFEAVTRACAVHASRTAQSAAAQELQARVADALADVELKNSMTVDALLAIVEKQDPTVRARARRVADLSVKLAVALGIPEPHVSTIERVALLNDCGALAIPPDLMARITGGDTGPGDEAPTSAQIVAVACAYDRVTWAALPAPDAVGLLTTERHSEFNPSVLGALQTLDLSAHV
jgi:response regulator RpfG family c-di-GMP phosphodiesterase